MSRETIRWEPWAGVPADHAEVAGLATRAIEVARRSGMAFVTTGDTVVIASRCEDGRVEVRWCLLRQYAEVP